MILSKKHLYRYSTNLKRITSTTISRGLDNVENNNMKAYQGVPMLVFVLLEDFFPPPPLIPEKSGELSFM
jgi:hypothetical protein